MATYREIIDYIDFKYNYVVKTCWIADMKQKCGIIKKAGTNNIKNPCPTQFQHMIKEAFDYFDMCYCKKKLKNWIYKKSRNNKNRYILGKKGNQPLIVIGVNPSTAKPFYLDRTVNRIDSFVLTNTFNAYDSWIMLNLYPQISTNPKDLDKEIKKIELKRNLRYIRRIFRKYKGHTIVAAWGNLIGIRDYLIPCLEKIYKLSKKYKMTWKCFDINKKTGHPKHPLYCSSSTILTTFQNYNVKKQYNFK